MPLVMFENDRFKEDPDEWDICSMCSRGTVELLWVRGDDTLIALCGTCVETLQRGFAVMLSRRRTSTDTWPPQEAST